MTIEERLSSLEKQNGEYEKRILKLEKALAIPDDSEGRDEKFNEAIELIKKYDKATATMLQRRLGIGYARAERLLDQLSEENIIEKTDQTERKIL